MTTRERPPGRSLSESLSRIEQALEAGVERAVEEYAPPRGRRAARQASRQRRKGRGGTGAAVAAGGLAVIAAVTGVWLLWFPAILLALLSVALFAWPLVEDLLTLAPSGDGTSHIGVGVSIEEGAVVEAGASLQAGAVVRSGARVERGAVVGMGAVVEAEAIVRRDARLGWGAVVKRGAEVGEGAVVGTGAVVKAGVKVQPGTVLGVGAVVSAATSRNLPAKERSSEPLAGTAGDTIDPRERRVDELCGRLDSELRQASPEIRSFLGSPEETIAALRRTCHELLRRERLLRAESTPSELERIERERQSIEARIAGETDEVIRERLRGAVGAIDEQKRQREILLRNANRLEAEHTRLVWTLEGLLSQVIRLRSEGLASTDVAARLDQSLLQLSEEVNAVAGALEEVNSSRVEQAVREAGGPAAAQTLASTPDRIRERGPE